MAEKTQIHPSVDKATIQAVIDLAGIELRTFSQMVSILLAEALNARQKAENKPQGDN